MGIMSSPKTRPKSGKSNKASRQCVVVLLTRTDGAKTQLRTDRGRQTETGRDRQRHIQKETETYGTKSAGREKSALNGNNQASLGDLPCPNHPSYRLGSFTQLEIYCMRTCTKISHLLGRQEACAGKVSCFLLFQEI